MGPLLCLLSAACFGAMAIFGKLAYDADVGVGDLLFVRFGLAAVILLAVAAARGVLRGLPRRALLAGLAMGAIGYAAQSGLFFGALERMDASLLALILGVSRTVLAMARDRHLPHALAAVHPRHRVPHRAELAVGAVVAVVVMTADVRDAIGFSSFGVLVYYAVANASTLTLRTSATSAIVPIVGLVGCVVLAVSLPRASTMAGVGVLALGAVVWWVRERLTQQGTGS